MRSTVVIDNESTSSPTRTLRRAPWTESDVPDGSQTWLIVKFPGASNVATIFSELLIVHSGLCSCQLAPRTTLLVAIRVWVALYGLQCHAVIFLLFSTKKRETTTSMRETTIKPRPPNPAPPSRALKKQVAKFDRVHAVPLRGP